MAVIVTGGKGSSDMTDAVAVGEYEYDESDPQFWTMEHNDVTELDMMASFLKGDIVPLVDEAAGGIIAYVLRGNEESLLAHLNGR